MSEFLAMGGYGKYLWPAFALGFGIVVLNLVLALNSLAERQAGSAPAHGDASHDGRARSACSMVAGIVVGVSVAAWLGTAGIRGQRDVFLRSHRRSPPAKAPAGERFRLGGMVEKGSVREAPRARSTSNSWSPISNTRCR